MVCAFLRLDKQVHPTNCCNPRPTGRAHVRLTLKTQKTALSSDGSHRIQDLTDRNVIDNQIVHELPCYPSLEDLKIVNIQPSLPPWRSTCIPKHPLLKRQLGKHQVCNRALFMKLFGTAYAVGATASTWQFTRRTRNKASRPCLVGCIYFSWRSVGDSGKECEGTMLGGERGCILLFLAQEARTKIKAMFLAVQRGRCTCHLPRSIAQIELPMATGWQRYLACSEENVSGKRGAKL